MTAVAPTPLLKGYKKGVPVQTIWSNRELTPSQEVQACADLGVGWAYNYFYTWDTSAPGVKFLPMIFGSTQATAPNLALAAAYNTVILGFNEPYNPPPQASMSQATAASLWPLFTATAALLASPTSAPAQAWLPASGVVGGSFFAILGSAQWNYTALHIYSSNFTQPGVVQQLLDAAVIASFQQYGKKIIISEFGLIGFTADPATWTYPSSAQWASQLAFSGPRLNANDMVSYWCPYPLTIDSAARIVNANAANLTLCNLDGSLTLPGQTYAAVVNYP
jgi:hypothetical protein